MKDRDKITFLEGVRGMMALNVILNHFIVPFYPQMYYLEYAKKSGGGLSIFAKTPLAIFVNGNVAVQFFLVLTGFLVGRSAYVDKPLDKADIVKKCVKRYTRLLPVIAVTTIFTHLTMIFGLQNHIQIAEYMLHPTFMLGYCNFEPSLLKLIKNIFLHPLLMAGSDYIGPFWMLSYEFWGYTLCLVTCFFFQNSKSRRLAYLMIAILVGSKIQSNYIGLFIGLLVADFCYNTKHPTYLSSLYTRRIRCKYSSLLLYIVGIFFVAVPPEGSDLYEIFMRIPGMEYTTIRAIGMGMVMYAWIQIPLLGKPYENKVAIFLGSISYEIYAVHWPIMLTLQAYLFGKLILSQSYNVAALTSFFMTVPVIIVVAYMMHVFLEKVFMNKRKGLFLR